MPTTAKLVAGLILAFVMFAAVVAAIPGLPEGAQVGRIREVSALIGFLSGWIWVGPAPGRDRAESIASGMKGVLIATAFVLLVAGGNAMYARMMRMMYGDPIEALLGLFEEMMVYGSLLGIPKVAAILVVGGFATGWLTREAALRWR